MLPRFALIPSLIALLLPASTSAQSVSVSSATVAPGGTLTVTVSGGPGSTIDWITVAPVGSADSAYQGIWFLNGTAIPPAAALTSASFPITVPSTDGTYEVRFNASGYYQRLATSGPIVVGTPGSPPPPVAAGDRRILFHGDSNSADTYESGSSNWTMLAGSALGFADIQNLALSGAYSDQIVIDLPQILHLRPDLVVVMVGTNDMAQAVQAGVLHAERTTKYLQNIQTVIGALREAHIPTVVLSPIFTLNARETARYPDWISGLKTICMLGDVKFVDVWSYMAKLSEQQTKEQFEAYYRVPSVDAWHLSTAGHAMLADFVARSGQMTP